MGRFPVLLLTTTGRTSGEPRDVGLSYVEEGGRYYVAGSYAGEDRDPAWARNLAANPNATVSVRGRRRPAIGRALDEPERSRIFERFVERDPAYAEYRDRTERTIPVIELTPQD
jgi:deazaflavin-dependent oxidoreductase (nitroreductase family)